MDPTQFHKNCVTDTCSIWNLMASKVFYGTARAVGCNFCCTKFVEYECLYKKRKKELSNEEEILHSRFRKELEARIIQSYQISIEDLHSIAILESRKKISKGELSTLTFALQTRQAFLSDDKGAIKLAFSELKSEMVQSTSLLFAWLFYHNHLLDHQKEEIIVELENCHRNMRTHFEDAYYCALKISLLTKGKC